MQLDWSKLLSTKRQLSSPKLIGDFRSEFERDYDRALFSTPVRRLQDKAQVFPLESNDSIRTRLTHSMEVAGIARTLGYYCAPFILKSANLPASRRHDIEILCQTCGLLHDVGNPPFGHAGEEAIRGWFKQTLKKNFRIKRQIGLGKPKGSGRQKLNDFRKFDGNSQTFRILTRLQLIDNYAGLNLTYSTLAALLKYTAPSHKTNDKVARLKKHGYFFSENGVVAAVRKETGLATYRHPLTYLIEAADDIAYSVVDIEDALKKGVIQWDLLKHKDFAKALDPYRVRAEDTVNASQAIRGLSPEDKKHAFAVRLRTILITELVASVIRAFKRNYSAIMNGTMEKPLEKCCDRQDVFAACKSIAKEHVYFARETLKLEIMGRKVVTDLMDIFWEGASGYKHKAGTFHFPNKIWEMLSPNYRHVFKQIRATLHLNHDNLGYYDAFHLVADHVCGMTDSFACRQHREFFNAT